MVNRLLPALLALGLILAALSRVSALQLDSVYLAEIRTGIKLTVTERFDEARKVFQTMTDHDTTDHAAYLLLAGVWHGEMFDREDYNMRPKFDSLISKALSLAEKAYCGEPQPGMGAPDSGKRLRLYRHIETKVGSWWVRYAKVWRVGRVFRGALGLIPLFL